MWVGLVVYSLEWTFHLRNATLKRGKSSELDLLGKDKEDGSLHASKDPRQGEGEGAEWVGLAGFFSEVHNQCSRKDEERTRLCPGDRSGVHSSHEDPLVFTSSGVGVCALQRSTRTLQEGARERFFFFPFSLFSCPSFIFFFFFLFHRDTILHSVESCSTSWLVRGTLKR